MIKLIKNTHVHPVNQALHCIGAPFYVVGASMAIGHFAGMQTDLAIGITMWIAGVSMFVAGHRIENNIESMTPVLVFRLASRKIARYFVAHQFHFSRT